MFKFTLHATQNEARAGTFETPHGVVETPAFMPVGTHSTLRSLIFRDVREAKAQIILSNAYHLYLRPGHELIKKAGGLHGWMNWDKPILTDSGGFQVFSLGHTRKITEEGVTFRDPVSGNKHFIGPEQSMEIQNALGADVIMAFDECPPYPVEYDYAKNSMDMTHRWLDRCFEAHQRKDDQALFPIVQGSVFEDLRTQSAQYVTRHDAVGFAIGGVSVGEPKDLVRDIVSYTAPLLPKEKPRYLMGIGTPEDILNAIALGVDMFDCVNPTRIARHGSFFTKHGQQNIKRAEYKEHFAPMEEDCDCYTCQHHHVAYLRHLMRIKESSGGTLLSIHNVRFLIRTAEEARKAVLNGTFDSFYATMIKQLQSNIMKEEESVV